MLSGLYIQIFTVQVVANIPFNISTDVVKKLLPMGDIFSEVILLLQVWNISKQITWNRFTHKLLLSYAQETARNVSHVEFKIDMWLYFILKKFSLGCCYSTLILYLFIFICIYRSACFTCLLLVCMMNACSEKLCSLICKVIDSLFFRDFQDEAALRLVDSSINSPDYRPINIFVNFYSGDSGTPLRKSSD